MPRCGPSENFDECTDRFPAGLSMLFWLTNGSGGRFFPDAKAWKRGSSEETTPQEKSYFSEYHGSASSIWRKALPVSSVPIHQKVGRAHMPHTFYPAFLKEKRWKHPGLLPHEEDANSGK